MCVIALRSVHSRSPGVHLQLTPKLSQKLSSRRAVVHLHPLYPLATLYVPVLVSWPTCWIHTYIVFTVLKFKLNTVCMNFKNQPYKCYNTAIFLSLLYMYICHNQLIVWKDTFPKWHIRCREHRRPRHLENGKADILFSGFFWQREFGECWSLLLRQLYCPYMPNRSFQLFTSY